MIRFLQNLIILAFICLGTMTYGKVMQTQGFGPPPPMAPIDQQADAIFVDKSNRELTLLRNGDVIRSYEISLGMGGTMTGHKTQEGDQKTPEGTYKIDWRNPNSVAHLSLHISYPNADDIAHARARGVSPGGDIMVHGLLNGWGVLGPLQTYLDWTNGCIAVTNAQIREIWSLVPDGTPITITE